jgi:integrase
MRVKSGDIHRHPLIPESITRLTALAKDRKSESPLFIGHLGKPWASGSDLSAWLCHSLGCGVLALRRYAITRMLDLGLDARTAASITGHRTPSLLLNTYARTNETRQLEAVEKISSGLNRGE